MNESQLVELHRYSSVYKVILTQAGLYMGEKIFVGSSDFKTFAEALREGIKVRYPDCEIEIIECVYRL